MKYPALSLTAAAALCAAPHSFAQAPETSEKPKRPNVIVILADDLGYRDTGAYGGKDIPTPHIDALAQNGVRFTQGYMTCPVCSPSRAGLLTGRYQQRYGFEFLCNVTARLKPGAKMGIAVGEKTIGDRMRALGYVTGALGKWHVGFDDEFLPMNRGFDEVYGDPGQPAYFIPPQYDTRNPGNEGAGKIRKPHKDYYITEDLTQRARQFISQHKDEPFFLYIAHKAVHTPLEVTEKYLARLPKENFKSENRRLHAAMTAALDDSVGGVIQALRENGLEENTLIFFSSDNGGAGTADNSPLRAGKGSTWEGGIRVPFILQWKDTLTPRVRDTPVSSLDILPTAVAAAHGKIDPDWKLDGVNLLPWLKGEKDKLERDALYWRLDAQWAVRQGDWKLVQGREGKSATSSIQVAVVGDVRLYNLAQDIGEKRDLAKEQPEKVKELQALYDNWNAQLMEPLWAPHEGKKSPKK